MIYCEWVDMTVHVITMHDYDATCLVLGQIQCPKILQANKPDTRERASLDEIPSTVLP